MIDAPTILLALVALLRPAEPERAVELARLAPIAEAIIDAVDDAPELPWPGPSARAGAAYALVALAWHESGFDAAIISCRRRGALGDATAWQLLGPYARGGHTVDELCASLPLAASRALAVLSAGAHRCRAAGAVAAFQAYAAGPCGRPAPIRVRVRGVIITVDKDAGATRCVTWARLALGAGIAGATCWARPFLTPTID